MIIKKLILEGHNGFDLSGITRLEITFVELLTIVLGTNGSGKSRLLREMTPLPGVPADFNTPGRKYIEIEHRGDEYHLESVFGRSSHHSFKKSGEELNPGGTAAIQKELCERYFNFTHQLHDVLSGKHRLTEMGPTTRREWLMALSSTDLSYATKLFDVSKTNARDASGALKISKERLAKESSRLVTSDDISGLSKEAKRLNAELQRLISNKTTSPHSAVAVQTKLKSLGGEIQQIFERIQKGFKDRRRLDVVGHEELESSVEVCIDEGARANAAIERYQDELEQSRTALEKMQDAGTARPEVLNERIQTANATIANLPGPHPKYDLSDQSVELILSDAETARTALHGFISALPDDYLPTKTLEECKVISEALKGKYERQQKMKSNTVALRERTNFIKGKELSECPQCKYAWRPGVSENELETTVARLKETIEKEETLSAEIERDEQYLTEFRDWREIRNRLKIIYNTFPRYSPLWHRIEQDELLKTNPSVMMNHLNDFLRVATVERSRQACKKEIKECQDVLEKLKLLEGVNGEVLSVRVPELERLLSTAFTEKEQLTKRYLDLQNQKKRTAEYVDLLNRAESLSSEYERQIKELLQAIQSEEMQKAIESTASHLGQIQSKLNEKDVMLGIVQDIKDSVSNLEIEYEAWKILSSVLSPQTGIIAEQMTGFIDHLCAQMNQVISRVWTYDLELLPSNIGKRGLDYTFPFRIGGRERTVKDIAKGSTGQRDIIDFAFMVVVMHYKDLRDYPMYLDETGASFDPEHRDRLLMYIKYLIEAKQCSQIMLVNHYATFSGGLTNAETCVLDDTNITLPEKYNQHVIIE